MAVRARVTPLLGRNAPAGTIWPWNGSVPDFEPVSGHNESLSTWCPIASGRGHGPEDSALSGAAGQACFWFSNGCSIGCPECMPTSPMCPGPSAAGKNTDFCSNGMKPTLPDAFRTYNNKAASGSKDDRWMSTPWRAPGTAPVLDACGMAGGTPTRSHSGAQISPTPWFKQGDLGSKKLPGFPTGTAWEAGGVAEVSWAINANHGGGYSYRLCPKTEPLTEACFQKMPLEFVNGSGALRWDGPHGTTENIAWPYLKTGTHPPGSSWARNPIPRQNMFPPPCRESPECKAGFRTECRCSGMWGPYNLEIVDKVKVPKVPAGDYVVGWRWDCEVRPTSTCSLATHFLIQI